MIDPVAEMVEAAFESLGGLVGRSNRIPIDAPLSKAEWLTVPVRDSEPTQMTPPRYVSWEAVKTGTLEVTITGGKVYLKGVSLSVGVSAGAGDSITGDASAGWVVTLAGTSSRWAWVEVDFSAPSAYLKTGAADPGDGTDTVEYIRIFKATVASSKITGVQEWQHGDIHLAGNV